MTALQQIVKEAKRMRKLHPNKYAKWTDYVKAASKAIKKPGKKVAGTKAKPKPKPATHTDKGSHNVKIKVVSGAKTDVNKFYISQLALLNNEMLNTKNYIEDLKKRLPTYKTKEGKTFFRTAIKEQKNKLVLLRHQIMMIKRNIK